MSIDEKPLWERKPCFTFVEKVANHLIAVDQNTIVLAGRLDAIE
jgi:hypothetical protein